MRLYHFPSPNPQKVTFALLELGLDCEKIHLGLDKNFRTGQTGSYTVNRNCTGFITIDLGATVGTVTNAFVISNGGRLIHAVIAAFTAPNGAFVTPLQSRIDFWEVASEENQQQ